MIKTYCMKLKTLPLFLCLFIALVINSTPSYSAKIKDKQVVKLPDYKEITLPNSIANDYNSNSKLVLGNHLKNPLLNQAYFFEYASSIKSGGNINEENSYILASFKEKAKDIELQNKLIANKATFFNYGLYYGFAFTLVLLNFVCFFLFEEKLFLFYSLAIAGITSALFYNDGLVSILGINLTDNISSLEAILLLVAISFSSIFASKYLSLQEFYPKLKYISTALLLSLIHI